MIYRRRRILLSEIERQCRFALMAYDDATAALQKRDSDRFWYGLQSLVTAANHLRRLLPARGESPLNHPNLPPIADLLAAMEAWNLQQPSEPSNLSNIGPRSMTEVTPAGCVRCFDPDTSTLTLFGCVFPLGPLLAAIAEIGHDAEAELQHRREVV